MVISNMERALLLAHTEKKRPVLVFMKEKCARRRSLVVGPNTEETLVLVLMHDTGIEEALWLVPIPVDKRGGSTLLLGTDHIPTIVSCNQQIVGLQPGSRSPAALPGHSATLLPVRLSSAFSNRTLRKIKIYI